MFKTLLLINVFGNELPRDDFLRANIAPAEVQLQKYYLSIDKVCTFFLCPWLLRSFTFWFASGSIL